MGFEAVLIVSFGGPEGPGDVRPFLENVLRGRNVPEERKIEVARHYEMFGGVSPLNARNRELRKLLAAELERDGLKLPVYWGNRNWNPYLGDAVRGMKEDGVKRALAYVTSAYGSYSGCRQYLEDIERARSEAGEGAPEILKIRTFHNHPLFIEVLSENLSACLRGIPSGERGKTHVAFTAHSLPVSMGETSPYVSQLKETAGLVSEAAGVGEWALVFQSRSGPSAQPWLEPDILKHIEETAAKGVAHVIVSPIGFLSDHLEVFYDLDHEAKEKAAALGLGFHRAKTPGNHPKFIRMLVELIRERTEEGAVRRSLGTFGPGPDVCPPDCCARRPG